MKYCTTHSGQKVVASFLFGAMLFLLTPEVQHPSFLAAEQLTTVGIVDINRVYNSFYRDSQAVRDLERLRREYQREIDEQVAELETLRDRRVRAEEMGNENLVEDLDLEIMELQRFVEDLTRRRRQQLEARQDSLLSDSFLQQMQEAIQYVAESEGYTVVLRTDQPGLQWWSSEVEISDQVVQRLIQIVER
ncbi:MAG: OmpH family outer membrane protein [Alkalispirochaeta sp.]